MPKTNDAGHAKNIASFNSLISFCKAYGTAYQPSRSTLTLINLEKQSTAATNAIDAVITHFTNHKNATTSRQLIFKPAKAYATRIINALSAAGVDDAFMQNARTILNKIQGKRAAKPPTPAPTPNNPTPVSNSISASQQTFDNMVQHFITLAKMVATQPSYNPNEDDLKVEAINTFAAQMQAANQLVINEYTNWSNARMQRDVVMYTQKDALITNAAGVKNYVLSVFGASSPQYKQVNKLPFKFITNI